MKFDDVRRGDILCLNHFPYKPFKVTYKGAETLQLESVDRLHARSLTSRLDFEQEEHVIYDEKWGSLGVTLKRPP